jgi:nucleoside-diphosphate-sugar epimerase
MGDRKAKDRMRLFVFGLGYSALHLVRRYRSSFSHIAGTVRSAEKAQMLVKEGIEAHLFRQGQDALMSATHVIASIGPQDSDPALAAYRETLAQSSTLKWTGYLSSIAVYGDQKGGWVDETSPAKPGSERGIARLKAEQEWLDFGKSAGKAVHIFRLPGIYGPGRSPLEALRKGQARRLVKPDQVFNRVHVEDIALTLLASIKQPRAGAIYNTTDNEPSPPQDVIAYAAQLLNMPVPDETPFDPEKLSPMAASFYAENKRVSNALIKNELGVSLAYPTYREGFASLVKER